MVFVGFHVVVLRFPRVCCSTSVLLRDLSGVVAYIGLQGKVMRCRFARFAYRFCTKCPISATNEPARAFSDDALYSLIDFMHRLKRKVEPPRQRRDCKQAFEYLPPSSPSTFADQIRNVQTSSQDLFYQLRVSKFPPNSLLDLKSSSQILIINRLQLLLSSSDYSESPRRSLRITIGTVTASRSSSRVRLYLASPLHASSSELLPSSSHYA